MEVKQKEPEEPESSEHEEDKDEGKENGTDKDVSKDKEEAKEKLRWNRKKKEEKVVRRASTEGEQYAQMCVSSLDLEIRKEMNMAYKIK